MNNCLTDACLAVDLLGREVPPEVLDPEAHEVSPDQGSPQQDPAPDARPGAAGRPGARAAHGLAAAAGRAEVDAAFSAKFLKGNLDSRGRHSRNTNA